MLIALVECKYYNIQAFLLQYVRTFMVSLQFEGEIIQQRKILHFIIIFFTKLVKKYEQPSLSDVHCFSLGLIDSK